MRLIVGYVATRDREEAVEEEEEQSAVWQKEGHGKGKKKGEAAPSQTAGHFDVAPLWETRNLLVIYFESF